MDGGKKYNGEVSAEEILEEIGRSKKVECNCKIIKGDLNITQTNLPRDFRGKTIVNSEIIIHGCKIQGNIEFGEAVFNSSIDISSTDIIGNASFNMSIFSKEISIAGSKFEESISFAGSEFVDDAVFRATQFKKSAWFYKSIFKNDAQFDGAEFYSDVSFEEVIFEYNSNFRVEFKYEANFRRTVFKKQANFIRAKFREDALYIGAIFEGDLIFDYSEIYSDIYLTNATYKGDISFIGAQFGKRIFVSWDSIKDHLVYDGPTYLFMTRNYNNLELFDDADRCYFNYRITRFKKLKIQQKLIDSIPLLAFGYGVKPYYPVMIGALIILIFAIIYLLFGNAHTAQSLQNSSIISIAIFATQTRTESFEGWLYLVSIFEAILGVFIISCFIVSLAKTLR
ncbi:MAG TPA: pentapeptide repeat-containing protein [Rectinema sp.]|jgi:uncharacterized protein YjbI with pentapeptide repeats|nr:pentapeptide repeat-containing protein [Rectinema sp.]